MEEHQLKPSDLPELGTPSAVLAILEGESDLTVKRVHALAGSYFRVGEDRNFAIMSSEGQWKAVEEDGGFDDRVRRAVLKKDSLRSKKSETIK